MEYFLNQITETLRELNGRIGEASDYLYWAHLVLNSVRHNDEFSSEDLAALKLTFDQNVTSHNGGQNNFGCPNN